MQLVPENAASYGANVAVAISLALALFLITTVW